MKLKAEVTARLYVIGFSMAEAMRLLEHDRKQMDTDNLLSHRIDDLMGVYDCEYNREYGTNVSYMVEVAYDHPELHETIIKMVEEATKEVDA